MSALDPKSVTRLLPRIILENDIAAKRDLSAKIAGIDALLPEKLILSENPCEARIGRIGFSFPKWRFPARGFDGASLLERFGMQKLKRDTDIADVNLPDPARDLFGTGFCKEDDGTYIEYRRAYILAADENMAIIIRNNSYYFGRDRLASPVYVSLDPPDIKTMQDITQDNLTGFVRWQDVSLQKQTAMTGLLDRIDHFDAGIDRWLVNEGWPQLEKFLILRASEGKAPFVTGINPALPPWQPVFAMTAEEAVQNPGRLHRDLREKNLTIALLSGKNGDLPA